MGEVVIPGLPEALKGKVRPGFMMSKDNVKVSLGDNEGDIRDGDIALLSDWARGYAKGTVQDFKRRNGDYNYCGSVLSIEVDAIAAENVATRPFYGRTSHFLHIGVSGMAICPVMTRGEFVLPEEALSWQVKYHTNRYGFFPITIATSLRVDVDEPDGAPGARDEECPWFSSDEIQAHTREESNQVAEPTVPPRIQKLYRALKTAFEKESTMHFVATEYAPVLSGIDGVLAARGIPDDVVANILSFLSGDLPDHMNPNTLIESSRVSSAPETNIESWPIRVGRG